MAKPGVLGATSLMLRPLLPCPQHMEKLDLGAFVKLTDEVPWGCSHDSGTHFSLVLWNQEIKFKVGALESWWEILPVTPTINTH